MILNWSSSFNRAFKKITKNNPELNNKIIWVLRLLQNDPFYSELKSHKLKGILDGNWACKVEYDVRIVYSFVKNPDNNETEILLISIGTHEEVY